MTRLTQLADKIISRIKTQAELDALIEAAVSAEREACAKVCEEWVQVYGIEEIAAAIRARGK